MSSLGKSISKSVAALGLSNASVPNAGSRTDVGYVREHNEDSLLVSPPLFVVCDGMGGHLAGEVASEVAIQAISRLAPPHLDATELGHLVEEANLAVISAPEKGLGREGMGTTCTAAMLEGSKLAIAQVGDSRAYLFHNGALQQLTRDHSVVADLVESGEVTPAEARTHRWRSYITRALGLDPFTRPDIYELTVSQGDRLMLCSDGLYSMVEDNLIAEVLRNYPNPQDAADMLVEEALAGGGSDNITVIVADVDEQDPRNIARFAKKTKVAAVLIVAAMILLIVAAVASFGILMNNSAYLAEQDGNVAIYQGVPGDFLGMSFSELDTVTDVKINDLQPGVAERIREGDVRCDSLEAAYNLVDEYERDIAARQAE